MGIETKKILLIDLNDSLRDSRILLLKHAGYELDLRRDYVAAEALDHEGAYDLVIIAVRYLPEETILYSDRIAKTHPDLPILLLTDNGVYAPKGTLSRYLEAGTPMEFMKTVASMLAGSVHIREIPAPSGGKE
jgi:DNA-binding NtrC family response regulator